MIDWQPIATCDPYQQMILGHDEKKWIRFGHKFHGHNDWYYSGTNERSQYAQVKGDEPTHWMNLPAPPKKGDE